MNSFVGLPSEQIYTSQVSAIPKVLCIDDDPEILRTMRILLRNYEVDVITASCGIHGFVLAEQEVPNVIITDIRMPMGAGDYLLDRLKINQVTAEIPVIIFTGNRNQKMNQRMMLMGAEAVLKKPVHQEMLVQKLSEKIDLKEQEYESF